MRHLVAWGCHTRVGNGARLWRVNSHSRDGTASLCRRQITGLLLDFGFSETRWDGSRFPPAGVAREHRWRRDPYLSQGGAQTMGTRIPEKYKNGPGGAHGTPSSGAKDYKMERRSRKEDGQRHRGRVHAFLPAHGAGLGTLMIAHIPEPSLRSGGSGGYISV